MATEESDLPGDAHLTVVIVYADHSTHAAVLFEFVHPDFDFRLPGNQHPNNAVRFLPIRDAFVNKCVNKNALDICPTVPVDLKPLSVSSGASTLIPEQSHKGSLLEVTKAVAKRLNDMFLPVSRLYERAQVKVDRD